MSQSVGSGIAPLDERIGGLVPRRCYVLSGAPGTGKTAACLAFVGAAILRGEPAVILTQDDPTDLISEANYLGIDLEGALSDERVILIRYQLDFVRRFARAASPEIAFDELQKLIGAAQPARVVIDSVAPFLEAGAASGAGILALLAFLDRLGCTSMITYPADLAGLYDRRVEPLVQRAGAILHFARDTDRELCIEIRKIRYAVPSTAPVHFAIRSGEGIVAVARDQRRRADDVPGEVSRKLIVIDTARDFPEELLATLNATYQLMLRHSLPSAFADLSAPAGAVLVQVRRDTVNDALTLVRELRRAGNRSPIVLVTQFHLRADDRARALRAGADDFLAGDLHPVEFLIRMQGIMDRGHTTRSTADREVPLMLQPRGQHGPQLLDAADFRAAVDARLRDETAAFFTLVLLRPDAPAQSARLAAVVLDALRVDGGDLAGTLDGAVAVYLHAARRKDVAPFVQRIRERWHQLAEGDIVADVASYPVKKERVIGLLTGAPADGGSSTGVAVASAQENRGAAAEGR
jgi:KaiC/GvpD/RAD55 family RecA-like ATPase/DNA-binding response OmpR family regulator